MIEIRWHGRGGQGAKSMSHVLAEAWLAEGMWVQAFPEYGPERGGAPVTAYTRADHQPIRIHHAVRDPDAVVVLDPSLLSEVPVEQGLRDDGLLMVNQEHGSSAGRRVAVEADELARSVGARFANVVMLGALAGRMGSPSLPALKQAFTHNFAKLAPAVLEANLRALEAGYTAQTPTPLAGKQGVASRVPTEAAGPAMDGPPGGTIRAREAQRPITGSWRSGERPTIDHRSCVSCLLCWAYCPDSAIQTDGKHMLGFNYDHCKGCGICTVACPTGSITMTLDKAEAATLVEIRHA